MVQLSYLYMTTRKTIDLTIQTFIGKLLSLLFNMLSRFVIAFSPRTCQIREADEMQEWADWAGYWVCEFRI